jgi:hypothetical protein
MLLSLFDKRLEGGESFDLAARQLSRGEASCPFNALSVFTGMNKSAAAQSPARKQENLA